MKNAAKWVGLFSVVLLASGPAFAQSESAPSGNAPAAPAANPAVTSAGDRDTTIAEVKTLEGLRRNALRNYGMDSLAAGDKALRDGDYEEARKQYANAINYLPPRASDGSRAYPADS